MNKDKLLIFGCGGHAKVLFDVATNNGIEVLGFFDDIKKYDFLGNKTLGSFEDIKTDEKIPFVLAIGDNNKRAEFFDKFKERNLKLDRVISSKSLLSKNVIIGDGTVIFSGAIINNSTKIGKNCIINTGTIVEHDNVISNHVHISPGVCLGGNVEIGEKTWVGIGSTIINNIKVGKNCIIGAGTVIINNIPDNSVVVGVPGKIIKKVDK